MNIKCPHCSKKNDFPTTEAIICQHCDEPISDYDYQSKSKIGTYALVGVLSLSLGSNYLRATDERWSIGQEFQLVQMCVSESQKPLYNDELLDKIKICACSLEATQADYSYGSIQDQRQQFFKDFQNNTRLCKE